MTEDEARKAVVAEALSWVNTPYLEGARVKGAGVDCGQLLIQVYANVGLIEPFDTGYYSPQHHMHSNEERYLNYVLERSTEVPEPELGGIVMFRFGRVYSHGGVVIGWPRIVHALRFAGTAIVNVDQCRLGPRALDKLPRKFFTLWPQGAEVRG